MTLTLFSHLFFTVALVLSLIYGGTKSFKKRGVVYMQIVTLAVGSMLLGELYNLVMLTCFGEIDSGFNIGMLGSTGCFFFTWSLAYGQIDGLGDDRSKAFRKYRLIALIQPLLFAGLFVVDIFSGASVAKLVLNAFLLLPIAMTSYFSLKHIIIPDVEFGIFDTMRKYNICLLVIAFLCGLSLVFADYQLILALDIMRIVLAVGFVILVPTASKGVKKWFS